jgi:hypothetical protein
LIRKINLDLSASLGKDFLRFIYEMRRCRMQEGQRPSILTLLILLAIVCGVFNLVAGIILLVLGSAVSDYIFGIIILILGMCAAVAVGLMLLNKAKGPLALQVYAAGTSFIHLAWLVAALASGGRPAWGHVLMNLIIGGAILLLFFLNKDVHSYLES